MTLHIIDEGNLENTCCTNCGSCQHSVVYTLRDFLYQTPGVFTVCACKNCGLLYLNPRPTVTSIINYYPDDYTPYKRAIQDEKNPLMRFMRRRKIVKRRQAVEKYSSRTPGYLLDVGCSTGIFLDEMQSSGWEVLGIEINSAMAQYARERFGLSVLEEDLLEVDLPPATFDVVTFWDVLEHTFEPRAILGRTWQLLRPGGILVLTVPNWESIDRKIWQRYWVGFDVPRHLHVFPHHVLLSMLDQRGFRCIEDRCIFGGYFTFVTSARIWLRAISTRQNLAIRALEAMIDLPGIRFPFEPFFMLMDRLGMGNIRFIVARKESC